MMIFLLLFSIIAAFCCAGAMFLYLENVINAKQAVIYGGASAIIGAICYTTLLVLTVNQ